MAKKKAQYQTRKKADPSVKDWRNRPRKNPKEAKKVLISLRCTENQNKAIRERAAFAGMNVTDYIISCVLK